MAKCDDNKYGYRLWGARKYGLSTGECRRAIVRVAVTGDDVRRAKLNVAASNEDVRKAVVHVNYKSISCWATQHYQPGNIWQDPDNVLGMPDDSCMYHEEAGYESSGISVMFNCADDISGCYHVHGVKFEVRSGSEVGDEECRFRLVRWTTKVSPTDKYEDLPVATSCATTSTKVVGGENDTWGCGDLDHEHRSQNFGFQIWNENGNYRKWLDAAKLTIYYTKGWTERARRAEVHVAVLADETRRSQVTVISDIKDEMRRSEVTVATTGEPTRRGELFVVPPFYENVVRRSEVRVPYTVEDTRKARVDVADHVVIVNCLGNEIPSGIGNPWVNANPGVFYWDDGDCATSDRWQDNMSVNPPMGLPSDAWVEGVKLTINSCSTERMKVWYIALNLQNSPWRSPFKTVNHPIGTSCSECRKKSHGGIDDKWGMSSEQLLATKIKGWYEESPYYGWSDTRYLDGIRICVFWVHMAQPTRRSEVTVATGIDDVRRGVVHVATTVDDTRYAKVVHCAVGDDTRRAEVYVCFLGDDTRRAEVTIATGKDEVRRAVVYSAVTKGETRRGLLHSAVTADDMRKAEVYVEAYDYVKTEKRHARVAVTAPKDEIRRGMVDVRVATAIDDTRRANLWVVDVANPKGETRRAEVYVELYDYIKQEFRRSQVRVPYTADVTRRAVLVVETNINDEVRRGRVSVATTIEDTRKSEVSVAVEKESTRRSQLLVCFVGEPTRRAEVFVATGNDQTRRASVTVVEVADYTRRATVTHCGVGDDTRRSEVSVVNVSEPTRRAEVTIFTLVYYPEVTRRAEVTVLTYWYMDEPTRRAQVTVYQDVSEKTETRRAQIFVPHTVDDTRRAVVLAATGEDITRRAVLWVYANPKDEVRRAVVYAAREEDEVRRGIVRSAVEVDDTRRAIITSCYVGESNRRAVVSVALVGQKTRRGSVSVEDYADVTRRGVVTATAVVEATRRAHVYVGGWPTRHETRRAQVTVFGRTRPKHVRYLYED